MTKKERPALATRLRESAKAAGLTAEAIAERLEVTGGAVHAWWVGRNRPAIETLEAYAAIVGVTYVWLSTGEGNRSEEERKADWLFSFLEAVMSGQAADAAFDTLTHRSEALSKRERAILQKQTDAMREYVTRISGRSWESMSALERREALSQLMAQAQAAMEQVDQ